VEQQPGRSFPLLTVWLGDRGEWRAGLGGGGGVVEADDAQLARHSDPAGLGGLQRADRDLVAHCDQRRRPLRAVEQRGGGAPPGVAPVWGALLDGHVLPRDAGGLEGAAIALETFAVGAEEGRLRYGPRPGAHVGSADFDGVVAGLVYPPLQEEPDRGALSSTKKGTTSGSQGPLIPEKLVWSLPRFVSRVAEPSLRATATEFG
jgi:hypothetical protein